jgi:hypothetical protein
MTDFQQPPPPPSREHTWDPTTGRWEITEQRKQELAELARTSDLERTAALEADARRRYDTGSFGAPHVVSFYHRETGLFDGQHLIASGEASVKLNTPPDHIVIDGHHDHLARRVDLQTGEVVDYQPPRPSDEHDWNATTKRWQINTEIQQRKFARASALAQIATLEASQHRPMRELMRDPTNAEARKRLDAIEAEISELRSLTGSQG